MVKNANHDGILKFCRKRIPGRQASERKRRPLHSRPPVAQEHPYMSYLHYRSDIARDDTP
jgi:hypothetical protein